ncbi:MAG: TetR family transcriptional regulator [Alphaproteobacteria bacterium]|nr:TetR family transcriptional regulator [Alphaproteobacteria bacterium]
MVRRDTRTAILDAAVAILGRDGPDGFSASALAREVGVSKATLFHHFGSIDEIPLAAFERMISMAMDFERPMDVSLGAIIAGMGARNVAMIDERRNEIRAYFVFLARAMFDPKLAALVHRSGDTLLAQMRALLRPHTGSDAEAATLARLVAIFLDGLAVHLMAFDDPAEIESAWKLLARLIDPERKEK